MNDKNDLEKLEKSQLISRCERLEYLLDKAYPFVTDEELIDEILLFEKTKQ